MNDSARRSSAVLNILVAGAAGILFGLGLTYSELVNPARVIGFLNVAGRWDPTLAFVLAGALLVAVPGFQLALRARKKPLLAEKFILPGRRRVDKDLMRGAALFGIGWGLAGLCPGPAIVDLGTGQPQILLFVAAMAGGMLLHRFRRE